MDIRFDGKVAVITGGTAGIGLAIAETLGSLGAKVAICGTNLTKLDKAVEFLKNKNIDVYGKQCNVGSSKELYTFADNIEEHFGSIDIWVSNASIYPQFKIIDTSEELWDDIININLKSTYIGAKIAYNKMSKKGGVLINASSFSSIMPSVGSGVYAATKSAVTSMTKTLASELAPFNIRVCGFIPGLIETDMTKDLIKSTPDALLNPISAKRFGTPQDIADGVAFLASDYASYITGTCLEISGGKFSTQNPSVAWKI